MTPAGMSIMARACSAFAVAVIGGALSSLLARTHKRLCALISLGAGTLLGVTVFAIVPECLETLRWWQFLMAAATGYLLFALVSKYVFHVCPACAASHFDEATTHHFAGIAIPMMIALAIHCTVDGVALAAGQEESAAPASVPGLGLSMTFAICVHKMPEGLALGALLLGASFTRSRMFTFVAAVESTTLLGAMLGAFVFQGISEFWLAVALAHAGGGFLFLATHAVVGEILKHHKALVIANFLTGFSAIGAVILFFHLRD